jgi:hypothetical protein
MACIPRFVIIFVALVVGLASVADDAAANDGEPIVADSADARRQLWLSHPQRTAQAVRAPSPPVLDGNVDDAVWGAAPLQSGFTQEDPDHGKPASEKTTFQILYDDEALYVAAVCYDSEPDSIKSVLSRRDDWRERDIFEIHLDAHHDHQSGAFFVVGPSGWMRDGVIFNDDDGDRAWDGVWEARTMRRADGWSLEMRIPYHVLRFGERPVYTWGINAYRHISRRAEWDHWSFTPRGVNGWPSRFGHLEGIKGIEPKRSLEIFPFTLGRATLTRGEDDSGNDTDLLGTAGIDVRYGLSSSISLNGTINPDFGQVDADPAVLNLGVFETFLRERRPFFLEGNQIFESPRPNIAGIAEPTRLYHSRRIGRQPARFDLPDDSDEVHRPDNTTILGAVKISGKTKKRTAFGLLNAVTGSEFARIEQRRTDAQTGAVDTVRQRFRIEPTTNYFVGRVQQDVLHNSTVGAQLTSVHGEDFDPAYVGAGDLHVRWQENAYRVYSRVAVSRAGQDDDRGSGWEGALYFSKFSGSFGGQAYLDARSRGFDANDLGFMNRNDRRQAGAHLFYNIQEPYWFARRSGFNINSWQHNNFDGDRLARGVNFNMFHELHSYWGLWMGLSHRFDAWDDLVTRGGPVMRSPAATRWAMEFWADDRRPVSGWLDANLEWGLDGDNLSGSTGFEIELKPASQIEIEINPNYRYSRRDAQWVENIDSDGDDEDDRFIFGELKNRVFEIGVTGSWALTPSLSTQLFLQPFVTTGNYGQIKELARPRSYEFAPYEEALDEDPDFHSRSLRFNLVMRWEYAPGSTIFVVWQQNRDRDFDDADDPDFEPLADAGRSFTDVGDNIFLVKLNRWIGL